MTTTEKTLAETLSEGRKHFLHTMFTTALEGGINYWAEIEEYRWSKAGTDFDQSGGIDDLDGFHAVITNSEGDWGVSHLRTGYGLGENEPLTIDLEVMHWGAILFRRYCHGEIDAHGKPVPMDEWKPLDDRHYWRQWLVQEATNGAEGDSDAGVADQIVQWGLFGVGVYG